MIFTVILPGFYTVGTGLSTYRRCVLNMYPVTVVEGVVCLASPSEQLCVDGSLASVSRCSMWAKFPYEADLRIGFATSTTYSI